MKKVYLLIVSSILACAVFGQNNNVGIGLTNPNASAKLDIYSNSQGLLIPRMTSVERGGILSPLPNGLLVFDIDTGCVLAFDSVASAWKNLCALSGGTPGPSGANGTAGPTGANGVNGPTGATGPSGNDGPMGPTGASGNNGVAGVTGVTGATGATGPIGCNSTNYVIKSNGTSATCGIIYDNGTNVGIGTTTPGTLFTIVNPNAGAFQLQDGTQDTGYVLTSDNNGIGTWKKPTVNATYGILGAGVTIPTTASTPTSYLYTGTKIVLPPGEYSVAVCMLITTTNYLGTGTTFTPAALWMRTTFADSSTATVHSADIVGSALASGGLVAPAKFGLVAGSIIINNTSGASKTYYYMAGYVDSYSTTATINNFGGTLWAEDNIVALQIR